jgi:energy-coupling factor transport system substrate-specific component
MKKERPVNSKILQTVLCVLICLLIFPFALVKGEEGDLCEAGGKHNGPVQVDPISQEDGYSAVLYDNTNGLPTSEANDIVQTIEGFIWIGSYAGLVRYDGSRFEMMGPETGITSVKCLWVDSCNRLWVGTTDKGVALVNYGEVRFWDLDDGMKSVSVRSIVEGADGLIYVATTEGLVKIDETGKLSYVEDLRLIDAFLHELRLGADGRIYAVNNPGDVIVLRDGKVEQFYRFSDSAFHGVNCILPDPEDPDLVYVETQDGNVYHDSLDSGFIDSEAIDIAPLDQVQSFEYFDGNIWVCTRNGVAVLDDEGVHVIKNVPMNNSIGHVMTDYEGNLWFTSTREGVMKIVKNRFTDIFERYSLSNTVVNSTCMYGDDLFIGTDTGLIVVGKDGAKEKVALNEAVPLSDSEEMTDDLLTLLNNCRIRSIIRDSKDRLWISTWRHYGLLRFDHGELRSFTQKDGLFSNSIRSVYEFDDGSIAVAGNGGVCVIRNDKVVSIYGVKEGIINTDVLCVTQGENKDIIIGTDGAGIYIISENGMKHIDHREGLTSESVMRIKPDRKRGVYWVVTGNSLSYLNADYELTTVDSFPYFNNFDLYENSKGDLWVLASNGIYVAKAEDILNKTRYDTQHFSMYDGLPCIATANSYSELTDDGDLYISGTNGVGKVNIEAPYESVADLLFTVPYVDADGVKIYPDDIGRFFVPADTKKLTIYGSVFNYSLVDPQVSYKLEGFDEERTTGNANEILPVYYTNLPGGTYSFLLELKYSMSDSTIGTMVQIIKEKAIYEQLWFYIYAGLSTLIVISALVLWYVDEREKKLEIRHKEESEKQRIANELAMGNSIQQSMLPHIFPPFPERNEFELFASMDPAREVGGDFYDFFFVDDDHLCMVMADVSGKGIPGALFMMVSKAIIHNSAMFEASPAKILTISNEAICSNNTTQMFVTVWLGILDTSTGKLVAANAGHEYPIVKDPEGTFEILKDKHDFVLGGMEDIVYHEYELQLSPGSKIFLYTDGIPEATDGKKKMFGMERLLKALNKEPEKDPQELMVNVRKAVDSFVKDAEQFDDLTMMCLEYKGKEK